MYIIFKIGQECTHNLHTLEHVQHVYAISGLQEDNMLGLYSAQYESIFFIVLRHYQA